MVLAGGKIRKTLIIFLLFVTSCTTYVDRPSNISDAEFSNDVNECVALFVRLNPGQDTAWAYSSQVFANCMHGKGKGYKVR